MAVIASGFIREVRFFLPRDKTLTSPPTVGDYLESLRPLYADPFFLIQDEVNCPPFSFFLFFFSFGEGEGRGFVWFDFFCLFFWFCLVDLFVCCCISQFVRADFVRVRVLYALCL